MRRARMPALLALIVLVIAGGCNPGVLSRPWRQADAGSDQQPADSETTHSQPLAAQDPGTDEDAAGPVDAGGEEALMSQRIQDYVNRLPSDHADGGASGGGTGQASAAPPTPAVPTNTAGPTQEQARLTPITVAPPADTDSSTPVSPGPRPDDQRQPTSMTPMPSAPATAKTPAAPANRADTASVSAGSARTAMAPSPTSLEVKPPAPANSSSALRVELVDVRPAAMAPADAGPGDAASFANLPTGTSVDREVGGVAGLIAELEQAIRQHPEQLGDEFRLRLLDLATGQEAKAVDRIAGADPLHDGLVSAVCRVARAARQVMHDPSGSASAALGAADELRRLLGQQSPVIIPKVALVNRVNSFGDFEEVSPPRFPTGRGLNLYLYTEVANFRSEPTADGRLRTWLSESVEVFDAKGNVVWQRTEPSIEDRALSPRHDFFIPFPVQLPANTPAGEYVLKATVEDKLGATTDQRRLTFTIGQ